MLYFKNLKGGDEVKVINHVGNNIELFDSVKNGDVAIVKSVYLGDGELKIELDKEGWEHPLYFLPHQIEHYTEQTQPEDFTITKSRWDEIIENLNKPLNCTTKEEAEIIQSVLKNNVPFCVASDPIDPIIEKEQQTHLDATHIGDTGNASFYYKSELLKK